MHIPVEPAPNMRTTRYSYYHSPLVCKGSPVTVLLLRRILLRPGRVDGGRGRRRLHRRSRRGQPWLYSTGSVLRDEMTPPGNGRSVGLVGGGWGGGRYGRYWWVLVGEGRLQIYWDKTRQGFSAFCALCLLASEVDLLWQVGPSPAFRPTWDMVRRDLQ